MIVRAQGERLGGDLGKGGRRARVTTRHKVGLLKQAVTDFDVYKGPWDYAHLTARTPWIENVARLAVVDSSLRTNSNDFLMTAAQGTCIQPYAGVYFRAPEANVPILVSFLVNALKSQKVRVGGGGQLQITSLTAGSHHLSVVLVPQSARLYYVGITTQQGNPSHGLLELKAVELTTLIRK
jgi:hypothetical protein